MDYEAYATAITDELRAWVHEWLAGIQESWVLHAALGLPLPHLNYPLPLTFPFGAVRVWTVFEWVHEYNAEQLRHSYAVSLAFYGRTNGADSSIAWKILSGDIELGVFEIAGPIYDEERSLLPFTLGAELVVEGLLASLGLHRPIRLGSHVIHLPNGLNPGLIGASAVQLFELRTADQDVLRHVGARLIP
ncbi:hypothetical protein C8R43DRAFT_4127 [Mycena crocata]|nr:hypothetical protein C8R43DRAFT_4127 [Mycena crocata]